MSDAAGLTLPSPRPAAAWPWRRLVSLVRQVGLPVLLAVAVLAGWEIVCRTLAIPAVTLPAPTVIWATLQRGFPLIMRHAMPTSIEIVTSFMLALGLGLALATVTTLSRLLRDALFPNLVMFQLIPKIALAPLFIVWFGIGSESRLAYATFIGFFPILISTVTGLSAVPPDLLRLARSLPATPWQIFRTLQVPAALPHLFSAMKVTITLSIIGVIVGEFITSQRGLGYIILFAASKAETALIFAAVAVLCVIGFALFGIIVLTERIVMRWYGPG